MSKYDKETKFYWLQLKEDFFEDDAIQWLEEQEPNGRDYAYFYLKLCLKSLKSNGVLIRQVGNILIPYDNKKLAELTKMDFDTVTVAMELLKQIGLIKILENGEIYILQLQNLIGSQSKGALLKQQQRLMNRQVEDKCPPKIDIELKKDIELDIEKENIKRKKFTKPTLEEVEEYCKERNNNIDAQTFVDFYESKGWKIGNQSMKDWKACVRTWEKRNTTNKVVKPIPDWLGKEIKSNSATPEEIEEMEAYFKDRMNRIRG